MPQIMRKGKVFDVCVAGSGAAGGAAAKVLTEGGLDVVMLEAGPPLYPEKDYKEHVWPYELAHRGAGIGGAGFEDFGKTEFMAPNGAWTIEGEPYTSAPGSTFRWFRSRIVGAVPTTGGASPCASPKSTFARAPATAWETTGPSAIRTRHPITTRWRLTSVSSARGKEFPARRMESSSPRPNRAARKCW